VKRLFRPVADSKGKVVGEHVEIRESALGLVELREADASERSGRELRVVLIREGMAKSGRYYTRAFVEQVASAADGLRAFADHATPAEDRERPARGVRDVVGFYRDGAARVDEGSELLQAEATLHLFESAKWLAEAMREVLAVGPPREVMGLSIDAVCALRMGTPPGSGREVPIAERLIELRSVDVVTRASAGCSRAIR